MTEISPTLHLTPPVEAPVSAVDSLRAGVVMVSLIAPPQIPEWPNAVTSIIESAGRNEPRPGGPDWTPRHVAHAEDDVHYVPMNSSKTAVFGEERPGMLATSNLNGCTALAAGYRTEDGVVHAHLQHYDPVSAREVEGESGDLLKMSKLLAEFAGEQPVDVVVAYSKAHNPLYDGGGKLSAEDFPIDATLREGLKLPAGSEVLFIPYETTDARNLTPLHPKGHTLHVWRTTAGRLTFGWNGQSVEVGKPERPDDKGFVAARKFIATLGLGAELAAGSEAEDLDFY